MSAALARLLIHDALMEDLLSALRRHDPADSDRLWRRWDGMPFTWPGCYDDENALEYLAGYDRDHALTAWVQREAGLHIAAGRFEHALCLIDPYLQDRRPQ